MKRLYWAAGALVLAAVAALAVVPRFVDWNQWRGEIEERAGAWLGLPVSIDGAVTVDVLPTPRLTATQVTLGDPADPAARLRWVRAALDLREFLKGSIVLERVSVVEPQAHINRLIAALDVGARAEEGGQPAEPPAFLGRRSERPVIPFEIEDGVLRGAPIDGLEVRLDQVNGVLSLRPDALGGTEELAYEGRFVLAGRRLSGGFRLQPQETAEGATLRLAVDIETDDSRNAAGEAEARLTVTGETAPDAPQRLTGSLRLTADGLTGLPWAPPDVMRAAAAYAPGALTLEGRLVADRAQERLALEEVAASTPALRGTGGLALSLAARPRLDVRLALASLDLSTAAKNGGGMAAAGDLLAGAPGDDSAADPAPALDEGTPLEADLFADPVRFPERLSAQFERVHRALMVRVAAAAGAARSVDGLAVGLDLSIDTLRTEGGVVRQASLKASADAGELLIERAGALLPGGSDVSLFGFVATGADDPRFEGEVALQSDDARRILEWAGMEDEPWARELPRDRLRSVRLSASAVLDRGGLRVGDLLADVDAAAITGSAVLSLDQGPADLALDLQADALNLDAYRAPAPLDPTGPGAPGSPVDAGADADAAEGAGPGEGEDASREAALFRQASAWAAAIEAAPLTLDLAVERLSHAGRLYQGVRATLGARSGERRATLEVRDAAALGLRAGLRFPQDESRVDWRLALRLEAPALDQSAAALLDRSLYIQQARQLKQAALHATIDGNAAGVGFRADAGLGPGAVEDRAPHRLSLGGVLSPAEGGGLRLQVSQGEVATPDLLLEAVQMAALLPLDGDGPRAEIEALSTSYAGGLFSARGPIGLTPDGLSLDLEARAEAVDLDRLIGAVGPLLRIAGRADAAGRVQADALDVTAPLEGVRVEGRLEGRARLQLQDEAGGAAAGVRQLQALQRRLAADFPAPGGALSGALTFQEGRLTVRDLRLDGRGAAGRGRLTVDLDADRLEGALAVRADGEDEPYLELEASGPIERPDVRTGGGWISGN